MENYNSQFEEKYMDNFQFAGAKNSHIKYAVALNNNKVANPRKNIVVEGLWGLELARKYGLNIETFIFCPELLKGEEFFNLAIEYLELADNSFLVSKKVFNKISEKGKTDGLIAIANIKKFSFNDINVTSNSIFVVLDGVEIPGNIGTIIRTSDGVQVDCIFVTNRRARLTHPKVLKGAQGANLYLPIIETDINQIKDFFMKNNVSLFLTDTDGSSNYTEFDYKKGAVAFVAGSERYGIHREWYDLKHDKVMIPMLGECDSLNVAVSTSIFLYQARSCKDFKR